MDHLVPKLDKPRRDEADIRDDLRKQLEEIHYRYLDKWVYPKSI